MLLAVKAIDVQRGVWGSSSMWDVSVHAHVVPGRCVYKLVCPLAAVTVMYGALEQTLRPPSHLVLVLLHGNEAVAWNSVADQTASLKKHKASCVCVCLRVYGKRSWKLAHNTLHASTAPTPRPYTQT